MNPSFTNSTRYGYTIHAIESNSNSVTMFLPCVSRFSGSISAVLGKLDFIRPMRESVLTHRVEF